MKKTYTLFQQYIASTLLISLYLQSCGGSFSNSPLISTGEKQIASIQTDMQSILLPTNIQPLIGQELTAQGGHMVTCYEESGQLKADVAMNVPKGFSKTYDGLNVVIEQGAELSHLPRLWQQAQERRIHLQPAQAGNPAKIVIYKGAGLMGGGDSEDEGEEEGEEEGSISEGSELTELEAYYPELKKKSKARKAVNTATNIAKRGGKVLGLISYVLTWPISMLVVEIGSGIAEAIGELGDGDVEKKNIKKFHKLARIAQFEDEIKYQYKLGLCYEKGCGTVQDYNQAFIWYKVAAERGNLNAQHKLGYLYHHGHGIGQNYTKAKMWYERALEGLPKEYLLYIIKHDLQDLELAIQKI